MKSLFCAAVLAVIASPVLALTPDQHNAEIICMEHVKGVPKDDYFTNATYKPGYNICEKLLPIILTMQAAETAQYEYEQEKEDNKLLGKVAAKILPSKQK